MMLPVVNACSVHRVRSLPKLCGVFLAVLLHLRSFLPSLVICRVYLRRMPRTRLSRKHDA